MTSTNKMNRIIEPIFVIAMSLISLYLAKTSFVFLGLVPILFAIFYFNEGFLSFLVGALGTYLMGLFFIDKEDLILDLLPIILISFAFIIPIAMKVDDKNQILTGFIISSLVFIFLYKYRMLVDKLSLENLALNLKENFEKIYSYNMDLDIYRLTVASYPAVIASISLAYSIASVKLIRNYLAYRTDSYTDIRNLDDLRINLKGLVAIILIEVLIYYMASLWGIDRSYIIINLVFMNFTFFVINGLSLFDYLLRKSKLPLSRAFQRFFLLVLFQVLALPLAIIGMLDIFIDFRRRRKNEK